MYGRWISLFLKREDGSQRTLGPKQAKPFNSRTVTLFLVAAAGFLVVSNVSAEEDYGEVNLQGSWAYTARGNDGTVQHLAATPAAEGNVWLLLACRPDDGLASPLLHTDRFPFLVRP